MMKVKEIMTKKPVVVEVPGTRRDALRLLVKHNKTALPVVKRDDGKLVGLLTRQDIFNNPDEEQLAVLMQKDVPMVDAGASIEEAASLLRESDTFHLPVLEKGKLLGILTPTDFLLPIVKLGLDDSIEMYAKRICVPVYEETPVTIVLKIMKVTDVYALAVLDMNGKLSGIITDRDVFGLSNINSNIVISDLGLGEEKDSWTWEGLRIAMKFYYEVNMIELPFAPVREVMVRNPTTIFRETAISEAARLMRQNDFGQLPIKNSKDSLAGMLYDIDLVSAIASM